MYAQTLLRAELRAETSLSAARWGLPKADTDPAGPKERRNAARRIAFGFGKRPG